MGRSVLLFGVALALSGMAWADVATQTDWVGGPGIPGPVTDWGTRFDIGTDLDWDTTPGQLKLIIMMGEFPVGALDGAINCEASDFDYDDDIDIVACSQQNNSIVWFENLGGGDAWSQHAIATTSAPLFVQVADLDQDNDRDVIASVSGTDEIVWWENKNQGATWTAHVVEGDFDARQLRVQDFDDDGDADIVAVSSATGDVVWWESRLPQSLPWIKHYIDGSLLGAYTVAAGDWDNDGDYDVVAGSNTANDIVLYTNDLQFTGSWLKSTIDANMSYPYWLLLQQMDTDSRLEVVCAAGNQVAIYDYLDTMTSWNKIVVDLTLPYAYSITAADLDNEGDMDLAAMSWTQGDLVWYEHQGTVWERHLVDGNVGGATTVVIGDIDGDNVPDLAGTALYDDTVSWWRIGGFSSPGVCQSSIYDTGIETAVWQYILYSYTIPTYTSVAFNVRSSDNPADMGAWSPLITEPGSLVGYLENGDRYMQYLTTLTTTNPYATPSLKDVTISWTETGIEGGETPVLSLTTPNPVSGAFTLRWTLSAPGTATLVVYDTAGRLVRSVAEGWFEAGEHTTTVEGLPAGSYAACLQGEGFTALRRVVVLP